jgi:hypothetical protein
VKQEEKIPIVIERKEIPSGYGGIHAGKKTKWHGLYNLFSPYSNIMLNLCWEEIDSTKQ